MKSKLFAIIFVSLAISACSSGPKTSSVSCQATLVANNDGTITDNATGLMWTTSDYFFDKRGTTSRWINWKDAMDLASQVATAGHTDWRLPSSSELMTLVNSNCKAEGTVIVERFLIPLSPLFANPTYPFFWTSDNEDESAVIVNFRSGEPKSVTKAAGNTVRFVRRIN